MQLNVKVHYTDVEGIFHPKLFTVNTNDTIQFVRERIQNELGITYSQHLLIFDGRIIGGENLQNGSALKYGNETLSDAISSMGVRYI